MLIMAEVRDGTLLVVEQNLGGPCVARLKHDGVDRQWWLASGKTAVEVSRQRKDGYFIYGSSYRVGQSIDSGFRLPGSTAKGVEMVTAVCRGLTMIRFLRAVAAQATVVSSSSGSTGRLTLRSGVYGLVALAMKIDGAGKIQWQHIRHLGRRRLRGRYQLPMWCRWLRAARSASAGGSQVSNGR